MYSQTNPYNLLTKAWLLSCKKQWASLRSYWKKHLCTKKVPGNNWLTRSTCQITDCVLYVQENISLEYERLEYIELAVERWIRRHPRQGKFASTSEETTHTNIRFHIWGRIKYALDESLLIPSVKQPVLVVGSALVGKSLFFIDLFVRYWVHNKIYLNIHVKA